MLLLLVLAGAVLIGLAVMSAGPSTRSAATPVTRAAPEVVELRGDGLFGIEVVGEQYSKDAFLDLMASKKGLADGDIETALLVPQKRNPHDPSAVSVQLRRRLVGHLSAAQAQEFRNRISELGQEGRRFKCDARVRVRDTAGGMPHFDLSLDLRWPIEPRG